MLSSEILLRSRLVCVLHFPFLFLCWDGVDARVAGYIVEHPHVRPIFAKTLCLGSLVPSLAAKRVDTLPQHDACQRVVPSPVLPNSSSRKPLPIQNPIIPGSLLSSVAGPCRDDRFTTTSKTRTLDKGTKNVSALNGLLWRRAISQRPGPTSHARRRPGPPWRMRLGLHQASPHPGIPRPSVFGAQTCSFGSQDI